MWGQLKKLIRRSHPKTLRLMQEHRNADGTLWVPSGGTYERLEQRSAAAKAEKAHVVPEGFYPYVPEAFVGQWRQESCKADGKVETGPMVEECKFPRLQRVRSKGKLKLSLTVNVRLTGKKSPEELCRTVGGSSPSTGPALLVDGDR